MGRRPTNAARRRSKTNPTHTCIVCNAKIFNRARNAKYCKKCWLVMDFLIECKNRMKYKFKKRYKGYILKIKIKLLKK